MSINEQGQDASRNKYFIMNEMWRKAQEKNKKQYECKTKKRRIRKKRYGGWYAKGNTKVFNTTCTNAFPDLASSSKKRNYIELLLEECTDRILAFLNNRIQICY